MIGTVASAVVLSAAGVLTFHGHAGALYAWFAGALTISFFIFAITKRVSQRDEYVTVDSDGITAVDAAGSRTLLWGTIALLHVTRGDGLELSDANRLAVISISRRLERYDELMATVLGYLDRAYADRPSGARSRPLESPRRFSFSVRPEVFQTLGVLCATIASAWFDPYWFVAGLLGLPTTLWLLSRAPYAVTVGPVVTVETLAWTRELAIERIMTITLAPDQRKRPCLFIQDASGEWLAISISRLTDRPLELLDRLRRLRETRGEVPLGGAIVSQLVPGRGIPFIAAAIAIVTLVAATPIFNGGVLRVAAAVGSLSTAKAALALGSPLDLKGIDGVNALYLAAHRGRPRVAELLLARGASTESRNGDGDSTPLHAAAENGYPEIVRMLLNAGADPNARNGRNETPLLRVSLQKNPNDIEVAALLIDKGATIDAPDQDGWTPLHQAVRHGNVPVIAYLAKRGADLELANTKRRCCAPIRLAISRGQAGALHALIESGADINAINAENGRTPLLEAVAKGDYSTVEILVKAGARTDVAGDDRFQPLALAVVNGHAAIVRALIRGGARWDVPFNGLTPLQDAALLGRVPVVEALLDEGVDPNAGSATHPPPVVLAAERGHLDVLTLLVKRGGNLNQEFQGWTAMRIATRRGHVPVIEFIRTHSGRD